MARRRRRDLKKKKSVMTKESFMALLIAIIGGHVISLYTVKPIYTHNVATLGETTGMLMYVGGELTIIIGVFYVLGMLMGRIG